MNKSHHGKKKNKSSKSRSQSVASEKYGIIQNGDSENFKNGWGVRTSKVMGRYMVAKRDFPPGAVILRETPLVVGPCTGCKVQCLGCYQSLEQPRRFCKCQGCSWPICNPKCPGLGKQFGHTDEECTLLKETQSSKYLNYKDFTSLRINLHVIAPLRCLILKQTNPKAFEILMSMEPHNEIRKNIPDVWNGNQTTVVDKIRKEWGLTEHGQDEIHAICGILEVNAFEIGQNGVNIRGLYPTAFLMSHDCVPNTSHSDEEKEYKLTVRASTHISANQPITLSYAYTLQGTMKRREHLLENKFFECQCRRCSDPTELGTYTSGLRCPKCKNGLVLSTDPLDSEAAWSCNNKDTKNKCPGYTVTARSMRLLTEKISEEVEALDCNDIRGMELFLEKYRNVLHPTHYVCLGVKLSLSQLYGKVNDYLIHELSDELLNRKKDICKEIMKVFDMIEPGFTRLRGVTLYELHAPIMILTTRRFQEQMITKSDLRHRLKEVVEYLREAAIILDFEPDCSSEGMMGLAASDALLRIKDWEKIIGKI